MICSSPHPICLTLLPSFFYTPAPLQADWPLCSPSADFPHVGSSACDVLLQASSRLVPEVHSGLGTDAASSERPPLATLRKPAPPGALSVLTLCSFFFITDTLSFHLLAASLSFTFLEPQTQNGGSYGTTAQYVECTSGRMTTFYLFIFNVYF